MSSFWHWKYLLLLLELVNLVHVILSGLSGGLNGILPISGACLINLSHFIGCPLSPHQVPFKMHFLGPKGGWECPLNGRKFINKPLGIERMNNDDWEGLPIRQRFRAPHFATNPTIRIWWLHNLLSWWAQGEDMAWESLFSAFIQQAMIYVDSHTKNCDAVTCTPS